MKKLLITTVFITSALLYGVANAQKRSRKPSAKAKSVEIESLIFNKDLWKIKIEDFKKDPANKKFKFEWQSAAKKGLRSEGAGFKLLGTNTGEAIIISDGGNELKGISLSLYNKGDHGEMQVADFESLSRDFKNKISKKLDAKPRAEEKKGTVDLERNVWKVDGTSYQLEKSLSSRGRPEFLRFRIMSTKTAQRGEATADRTSLRANVMMDKETGDVFIDNIPMVDQGKKGYCACASAARIYQYYGRTTDQHEIAQIAGSSARGGTTMSEMVGALKKVTSSLSSRVNILYEYPKGMSDPKLDYRAYMSGQKEMMRDINSYQQLAKKTGKKGIPIKGEKPYTRIPSGSTLSFSYFIHKCDPALYREVMMDKSSFGRFNSKIKEYIDQGIPVGWCLQLGLFPEKGIPQARGGHMRLIIGYNNKKKQLIYSDSWGDGHAKKYMDTGEAFSMTNVILVLPPTK